VPRVGEIFTIGHSTHPAERFVGLLRRWRVGLLCDVRRYPGSRRHPQFSVHALVAALERAGIGYEPLGRELGGRRRPRVGSPNAGWRVAGFRGYADHMGSAEFETGRERLEALAPDRRTAIMCAEGDWRRCHRRLISDVLVARGWRVVHIRPDGRLEEHELTEFAVVSDGTVSYPGQGSLSV
jgi:uncharacterized protein (DUF488 family)